MERYKNGWGWLTAAARISLYNQGHWWAIPASLLFYGVLTAVQMAPYHAKSNSYGDGSLLLLSDGNLRIFVLNIIFLFIAANVGGNQQHDMLLLHRLGSRRRLWKSKCAVFVVLTIGYLGLVILFAEIASLPFLNNVKGGWSETILAYYGSLNFAETNSQALVWVSTTWFVFLSWLGLGGVAFIVAQTTGRADIGFFVAVALNLSGFMADVVNPASTLSYILDIRRPMLFYWYGEPMMSFREATAYWSLWFIALASMAFWHMERAGGMVNGRLRAWFRSAWLIMQTSPRRLWLVVIPFALISAWVDVQSGIGAEIDALSLTDVRLAPIVSLSGPPLEASLFSLLFLRWLLIFLIFLWLLGETAVRSLWQQHVMLLPRSGGRQRWWLSQVTAVAGLSLLYLLTYLSLNWLVGRETVQPQDFLFYGQIFILYCTTLTLLGCGQLLLLLFTHSRSQTLLLMLGLLTTTWYVGKSYLKLLPWLPVAQTAVLAQLLGNGSIDNIKLVLWSLFLLALCTLAGLTAIQRYQFMGYLEHQ